MRDQLAEDREGLGRGLALEEALHERHLRVGRGELAAERELELGIGRDDRAEGLQLGLERDALGSGGGDRTDPDLLDPGDEIARARPAVTDDHGEQALRRLAERTEHAGDERTLEVGFGARVGQGGAQLRLPVDDPSRFEELLGRVEDA